MQSVTDGTKKSLKANTYGTQSETRPPSMSLLTQPNRRVMLWANKLMREENE